MTSRTPRQKAPPRQKASPREGEPGKPPPELYARVRAAIDEDGAQHHEAAIAPRWWLGAIPLVAIAVLIGDAALRHLGLWRSGGLAAIAFGVALFAALTAWVTLGALSAGRAGLGPSVSRLRLYALSVGGWSALVLALVVRFGPLPNRTVTNALSPFGLPCMLMAAVIGSAVLALMTRTLLHAVPSAVGWRSAALGAAAGAWAGLALLVHCPGVAAQHLLVGHLLPIALFPLIGRLAAYRFLRV